MLTFTIRRLVLAVPTLLFISLVIFLLLQLAPGDPMAQVPLTVPPEVKQQMREALGLGQPIHIQYFKWIIQFFWIEPLNGIDALFGTGLAEGKLRVISWQTRSPVIDIVIQRLPQTLWVVGVAYVVGILIALADWNNLCLSAIFHLRSSRDIHHDDRIFRAPVFFWGFGDCDFLGAAGLVPVDLRYDACGR
jgi:hypothetical protein